MKVHYLELVSDDADQLCHWYERVHGAVFSEADPALGGARTMQLPDGTLIGIRRRLGETERSTVRPYIRVSDIAAALENATAAGGTVALGATTIEGHGECAIVVSEGIELGLWQAQEDELSRAEERYLADLAALPGSFKSRVTGWLGELAPSIALFAYGMFMDSQLFVIVGFLMSLYFQAWRMVNQWRGRRLFHGIYIKYLRAHEPPRGVDA
ncbi:MAG: hypothetical protein AAGH76_17775 [Pseudomonadota bacterium]